MKKVMVSAAAACMFSIMSFLASPSSADISIGYETLTILPNAPVLYLNDPGSGWGLKASADFGTSFISGLTSAMTSIFTAGLVNPTFSFATLSLTKDIGRDGNIRDYVRLGAFFLTARTSTASETKTIPTVGIGRDFSKFLNDNLTGNIELSFPEILTMNLRYSF
jgi:hypothetical protein